MVNAEVIARLESRRRNVATTLAHLREQQMEVERNTEWKDLCTQRRRNELVAELLGWYDVKLRRIEQLLEQVRRPTARRLST